MTDQASWPDTGCDRAKRRDHYHGPCVTCPLPTCYEDNGQTYLAEVRSRLYEHLYHAVINQGRKLDEVGRAYGVSRRTVTRAAYGR